MVARSPSSTPVRRLSADAARRIALGAQGLAKPRPAGPITRRHFHKALATVGLLQIDSVNVLVRAQEMPLFARLGPHPRTLLPDAVDRGEVVETWAHAASLLPVDDLPLVRWRMARRHAEGGWGGIGERTELLAALEAQVREHGARTIGEFDGRVRVKGTWWNWDDTKLGVEHLFAIGTFGATRRRADFARRYDLLERIIGPDHAARPGLPEPEARIESLRRAARAYGVATLADLADYYRLGAQASKAAVAELVADGELVPVTVEGWRDPAYLHPEATTPRATTATTLLSPFDPLVWNRDRSVRLFGFDYRIEIYTPAAKRRYGYYVLPFLLDGHLVGRVDLKADRQAGVLRVQAAHVEPGHDTALERGRIAEALLAELHAMAGWLDLDEVGATDVGGLAADLHRAGAVRLPVA